MGAGAIGDDVTTNTEYALEAAEHEIKRLEAKNYEQWESIQKQLFDLRRLDLEVLEYKARWRTAEMRTRTWMLVAGFAVVASIVTLVL